MHDYLLLNEEGLSFHSVSGDTKPIVQFPDEHVVLLDGVYIDSVKVVCEADWGHSAGSPYRNAWNMWVTDDHPKGAYGELSQQQLAFLHTVVAGTNPDGSKGTCGLKIAYNSHLSKNKFFVDITNCSEKEYTRLVWKDTFPVGVTNQGFMARFPDGTVSGDFIVVPTGSKVPFVLRKYPDEDEIGNAYFFVGECCKLSMSSK